MSEKLLHGCLTCKWAEFQRTPTGRIKRAVPGKCGWPTPSAPVVPISMSNLMWDYSMRKGGIWPDMIDCPVWEWAHD